MDSIGMGIETEFLFVVVVGGAVLNYHHPQYRLLRFLYPGTDAMVYGGRIDFRQPAVVLTGIWWSWVVVVGGHLIDFKINHVIRR